ncbi:helix-turn-helix domain-containing protein [Thalassolituus sp. UBA3500]|uniref:helix-turn-helix domain-containing protein n=1 Tax=Thalassolituus sp. UBA3500 TaxID=1947664 RepID=UPI000C0C84CF|nr:hypothetical protein [Thalassolituus sp. UBA3500]MBN57826.1 transcriptional regulator [Oceanospirillaceae bacterium]|tara:strand:+ start:3425 stop:3766 length:342 start_codon:yes stop_codon:yes gene_type:complete
MNASTNMIATDQPLWLDVLAEQCQQSSQRAVAQELNVSATMISQALNGRYPGDIAKLERAVRGAYMGATVNCPVLGELETHRCIANQKQKASSVNPTRVQLFRACQKCEYKEA